MPKLNRRLLTIAALLAVAAGVALSLPRTGAAPVPAVDKAKERQKLLDERVALHTKHAEYVEERYKAGISREYVLIRAKMMVLQAEMGATADPAKQRKLLEGQVKLAKDGEDLIDKILKAGGIGNDPTDILAVWGQFSDARIDAELKLLELP